MWVATVLAILHGMAVSSLGLGPQMKVKKGIAWSNSILKLSMPLFIP